MPDLKILDPNCDWDYQQNVTTYITFCLSKSFSKIYT